MATKADVEKLARRDPIVRAHLDYQRYGRGVTWDEMMCALVVSLVEAKDAASALALDYASKMPPQPMLASTRVPDGWQLVPVEPTDGMVRVVYPLHWYDGPGHRLKVAYKQMLATLQKPEKE